MRPINVGDLVGVIYSSGKVFNGLETGRLDTEDFIRSGNLEAVTSVSDLHLLQDLRDVAEYVITHTDVPIDATYVKSLNAAMSRSGAIRAGQMRRDEANIGVTTRYGRHEPPALTEADLDRLIAETTSGPDHIENALRMFAAIARAQPFEDGNKRTALFAANGYLINNDVDRLITVPMSDDDPAVAAGFNDALARAYIHGETDALIARMRDFVDATSRQESRTDVSADPTESLGSTASSLLSSFGRGQPRTSHETTDPTSAGEDHAEDAEDTEDDLEL